MAGQRGCVEPDTLPVVRRQTRVILRRLQAQGRREPARGDHRLVTGHRHDDGSGLELAHDVAQHLRHDRHAGVFDLGGHLHPVGDLQVGADELDRHLAWFRQLIELQQDAHTPEEFLEFLKVDLYQDEIFVFTPKGEIKSDFTMTKPGFVNDTLTRVFAAEGRLLSRWRLPVGVSIVCLAERRA